MAEPLVSVFMITYNHVEHISKAIEGALRQKTNFPIELVIGEDCSTDGTREIVFGYQEKYPDIIRVITSDSNVGSRKNASRTRRACRGKYIAFCDGDDYWHHPEKLQKQVDYIESHPECGLVCSNYNVYNIKTKTLIHNFITYKKWKIPDVIDPSYFIAEDVSSVVLTCTVLMKRELLESIIAADPYLYESGSFLMGDIQLWAESSALARIGYIPESLATYNATEESATRSGDVTKEVRFSISMAELMIYLCEKYKMPGDMRKRNEEYLYAERLKLAFHQRDVQEADEVRRRKKYFDYKDCYRYYGAKYSIVYYSYYLVALLNRLRSNHKKKWYE